MERDSWWVTSAPQRVISLSSFGRLDDGDNVCAICLNLWMLLVLPYDKQNQMVCTSEKWQVTSQYSKTRVTLHALHYCRHTFIWVWYTAHDSPCLCWWWLCPWNAIVIVTCPWSTLTELSRDTCVVVPPRPAPRMLYRCILHSQTTWRNTL